MKRALRLGRPILGTAGKGQAQAQKEQKDLHASLIHVRFTNCVIKPGKFMENFIVDLK